MTSDAIRANRSTIISLLRETKREGVENIVEYLDKSGFFDAPSSVFRHHNWRGGLAEHCLGVCLTALGRAHDIPRDSIIIAGLLHDVCKAVKLYYDENGRIQCHKLYIKGHGYRSVKLLKQHGLKLSEDERRAIRWHMGGHHVLDKNEAEDFRIARQSKLWKVIHESDRWDASGKNLSELRMSLLKDDMDGECISPDVCVIPPGRDCVSNALSLDITVGSVSFKMIRVEHGTFTIRPDGQDKLDGDAKPVRRVTLTKDYYIGETEVTQELWETVMDGVNPSCIKGRNLPVEFVSWNDCKEFISRLNEKTGRSFRIPTEAEWEFAARGGNKSKGYRFSGSDNLDEVAWCEDNSNSVAHPVKTKRPNELGIYDMSGNVWEWCDDSRSVRNSDKHTNTNYRASRVIRGGGWGSDSSYSSVTDRSYNYCDYGNIYLGMRLVLDL